MITQFKNTAVRMDSNLQTFVINKCKIFKLTSEETYKPHLINTLEYYITNITHGLLLANTEWFYPRAYL